MHSVNVIHRDIKPRNLLVNSSCNLKICDFGLARLENDIGNKLESMSNYVATRWYRAPEIIISRTHYGKPSDIWSAGCVMGELLGGKALFMGKDRLHQLTTILGIIGTPNWGENGLAGCTRMSDFLANMPKKEKIPFTHLFPNANPLACDLLDKMLQFDPSKRITATEALKHPFLEDLHDPMGEPDAESFDWDEFYFEELKPKKNELRNLIYHEILTNNQEEFMELVKPTPDSLKGHVPAAVNKLPMLSKRETNDDHGT